MTQAVNQQRNRAAEERPTVQRNWMGFGRIEKAQNARGALNRLLPYLTAYRLTLVLVFGCVVLYTLLGLVSPYLLGVAIDQYIVPQRVTELPRIALLMLAVYLLNNFFQARPYGVAAGSLSSYPNLTHELL